MSIKALNIYSMFGADILKSIIIHAHVKVTLSVLPQLSRPKLFKLPPQTFKIRTLLSFA